MNGGKTIWMIDGTDDGMLNDTNRLTTYNPLNLNLNDMLSNYGAIINHDLILDSICDIIHIGASGEKTIKWPYFPIILPKSNNILTKSNKFIKTKFISSIDTLGKTNNKKIILSSSNKSYKINAPNSFFVKNYNFQNKNIICGVLIEGEIQSYFKDYKNINSDFNKKDKIKENKIIIISDGDLITDSYKINSKSGKKIKTINEGNKEFIKNCVDYICDDFNLLELKNKNIKINYLDNKKVLNKRRLQLISTISPILILVVFGFAFNLIRKNKFQNV